PRAYGGLDLDVTTYARVIEELCRGWMSLAGVINSHTMAALIVLHHGTEEQRGRWLPRFAAGEARGGLCLTEPHAGSDVQAILTRARRVGEEYRISGTKMFVTNGREGNTFALLAVTDPGAQPRHRGMSCFIVEKGGAGLTVVKSIGKLGYKGVDTAELLFEDFVCPAANLVGGVEGRGFGQVMSGLEAGRINIAARAVGVAQAAFEEAAARGAGAPGRREEPGAGGRRARPRGPRARRDRRRAGGPRRLRGAGAAGPRRPRPRPRDVDDGDRGGRPRVGGARAAGRGAGGRRLRARHRGRRHGPPPARPRPRGNARGRRADSRRPRAAGRCRVRARRRDGAHRPRRTRRSPRAHARRRRRAVARGRRGGAGGRRGRRRRRAARAPVRRRRRSGGHARVHADPRRLRLHDGVSRRALLPRRRCAARGRARGRAALMAYGRYFE